MFGPPLVFAGDVMLNGIPPARRPLAALAPLLKGRIALANLEIPLTDARTRTVLKTAAEIARRDQFVLKADPRHAAAVRTVGFSAYSLANNHAMDFGPAGLRDHRRAVGTIPHAGAGENVAEAEGVAVLPNGWGMVSYLAFMNAGSLRKCGPATATRPGIAVLSFGGRVDDRAREKIRAAVVRAKRKCRRLVVALHWGIERQNRPTAYQRALGRAWIEAGADVVWGHHPHVLQGAEIYRGRPILYSMGNLVSPLPGRTGLVRWDGKTLDFTPLRIAGGRVVPISGAEARAERARWVGLCRLVR